MEWLHIFSWNRRHCFDFNQILVNKSILHIGRALNDTIRQLSILDENFKDLSAKDVATFDDGVPVTQGLMSDEEILSDILGNEVEEIQDEEDNGQDGASPLEKPTTSQLHDAIDTLMNYSMMIDTSELKALTIKVSRIVENEVIAGSRQSKLTEFFSVWYSVILNVILNGIEK